MESLKAAHAKIEGQGGLKKTTGDVQETIDLLMSAREAIASKHAPAQLTLARLKTPMKQSFEKVNQDVKEVYTVINNYTKALDKKYKNSILPSASNDPFSTHPTLTNRAVAMHLLREGQFGVASTFISEANAIPPQPDIDESWQMPDADTIMEDGAWAHDFPSMSPMANSKQNGQGIHLQEPGDVQKQFSEMYHILHALRNEHDLGPAIDWARAQSEALELRGSNLEFELCRLRFVELYNGSGNQDATGDDTSSYSGPLQALAYARATFPNLSSRYLRETSSLLGSLAFAPSITSSPYHHVFSNDDAWENIATGFSREFCGMLGLSEKSPLYTAVTAGGIALPVLEKLERVMGEVGGQWTSANELPVEIPLPHSYLFHSIFVCPVSKEQSTDANPPMMMPCGHVIAKESLEKISRGGKFKCPYCPNESLPREAKKVFL